MFLTRTSPILRLDRTLRNSEPLRLVRRRSLLVVEEDVSLIDFQQLPLKYPPTAPPPSKFNFATGWSASPAKPRTDLPFRVIRTISGDRFPVTLEKFREGPRQGLEITIVQKIDGDMDILKAEIEALCGHQAVISKNRIVIAGNFHIRIKYWLACLGF